MVTVNEPAVPTVKPTEFALVIAGARLTVTVNVWVAFGFTLLDAVRLNEYDPPAPVGVPDRVAVPLPLSMKLSPAGSAPVRPIAGAG